MMVVVAVSVRACVIFYMETRAQERTMKMKVEGSLDPKGRVHRLIEEARQGSEEGERPGG